MSWCVRSYIYLRQRLVNPIVLINDRERIKTLVRDTEKGDIYVMSSIEAAIIRDIEFEAAGHNRSGLEVLKRTRPLKMARKYIKLLWNIFHQNLEMLSYLVMILEVVANPGLATVIYPLSVFGYALQVQPRPPHKFWMLLLAYTSALMIIEFALSLRFWQESEHSAFLAVSAAIRRTYSGIAVVEVQNSEYDVFWHFSRKIFIIYSVMDIMMKYKLMDLY